MAGTRTTNIGSAPTLTQFIGNRVVDGTAITVKATMEDVTKQMLSTAPMAAVLSGVGFKAFISKAEMDADLAHVAKTVGMVSGDALADNDGLYRKSGGSGSGSWVYFAPLPYSFATATYTEPGTVNAILAESDVAISERTLVTLNVEGPNTGSPVTVSFNGGPVLTIKTASGGNVPPGALVSGQGVVSGSTFRLVSDLTSAAIQAAAEAAATASQASAALAAAYVVPAVKTANYVAQSGNSLLCDTTGGAWSLTLPANPATGAIVRVIGNGWATHNLTVLRNGQTIDGAAENLVCNYDADLTFLFINGTWSY